MKTIFAAAAVALAVGGCATTSKDVSAVYVSPLQYSTYDCDQLTMETQRIQVRASQMGARIDQSASNSNLATTAAVIIFWPAAFFTGAGNKEHQAEFARLKGESDALDQAVILKKCTNTPQIVPAKSKV